MTATEKQRLLRIGLVLSLIALFLSGCPNKNTRPETDAEVTGPNSLAVISPPGRDVGLLPGESVTLRVRYTSSEGDPLPGRKVGFSLIGETGGSTLSNPETSTNEDGLAEMGLMAGYTESFFEVAVSAEAAPGLNYSVAVSDAGFGSLVTTTSYSGVNESDLFSKIEVSLYLSRSCAELSRLRPSRAEKKRQLETLDDEALFEFLPIDTPYSITAIAWGQEQQEQAFGCVEVGPDALKQNTTLETVISMEDLLPSPSENYVVRSEIQLHPSHYETFEPHLRPWLLMGACDYGCAQSLLDCLVGALETPTAEPSEVICGLPNPTSTLGKEITELRGAPSNRCRGETTSGGLLSLDKALQETGGEEETIARLKELARWDAKALLSFTLSSSLFFRETGSPGGWVADHSLLTARFPEVFGQPSVSLISLGAPHLTAYSVSSDLTAGAPASLSLGEHAFALRLGRLFLEVLNSAYLGATSPTVNDGLKHLWNAEAMGANSACEGIDSIVCAELRRPEGCLGDSCELALRALAHRLEESLHTLDSTGTNLNISAGAASLNDEDRDMEAEVLGSLENPGLWQIQIHLPGVGEIALEVPFLASMPINPIR